LNEPKIWSSTELVKKLKIANIIVPVSLKKSQLIQIYRDNVINKGRSRGRENQTEEIEGNVSHNQDGDVAELPASSETRDEIEAGRMFTTGNIKAIANAVESMQQSMLHMASEISHLKRSNEGNTTQQSTGINLQPVENDNRSEARVASDSVPYIETVPSNVRTSIIQDGKIPTGSSTGLYGPSRNSIPPGAYSLLEEQAEKLCESSLSDNTRSAYKVGFTTYCQFLSSIGIAADDYRPPSVSEQILIYFVTHCCNSLKLSHSTIKLYLAAVRYHYVKTGVPSPTQGMTTV
jgi:hypothetical protein